MKTYVFHEDAGHGWLAVKRKELIALGIIDKVTPCSYQNGQTVYLEEDCDAPLFIRAMEAVGKKVDYRVSVCKQDYSPIRYYEGFEPFAVNMDNSLPSKKKVENK